MTRQNSDLDILYIVYLADGVSGCYRRLAGCTFVPVVSTDISTSAKLVSLLLRRSLRLGSILQRRLGEGEEIHGGISFESKDVAKNSWLKVESVTFRWSWLKLRPGFVFL